VYLKYVSPDDIHVYSIDEVFIDATSYLKLYKLTAREFAMISLAQIDNCIVLLYNNSFFNHTRQY